MAAAYNVSNITELFSMLESNNADVAREMKQAIYEQYDEVKEAWLVHGLFDTYCQSGSATCLQLLIDVKDPHEKFLMDKIYEGLKQQDKPRLNGLVVLGYIIRKQPYWLHKITQHNLMKELLKILKTEDDIVIMMTALLDLLALMPILPVHIAKYLQEIFDIFSRFASWRYQCVKNLPEVQKIHLQIGLFGFFHRLYGMFPCNFLAFLRQHYSETNKENLPVFLHTIRPMLSSVTMHPLLVTHSRELEKSDSRWKKMELHDIIVESSRYSLIAEESCKEDALDMDFVDSLASSLKTSSQQAADIMDPHGLYGSMTRDPLWTPSRKCDFMTPPPPTIISAAPTSAVNSANSQSSHSTGNDKGVYPSPMVSNLSRAVQDSPPEAAIEATPETTPYVTPVKQDEKFKFARPAPSSQVSRHLRLDVGNLRSPQALATAPAGNGSHSAGLMAPASKSSPSKDPSPFRFPEFPSTLPMSHYERRDSLFFEKTPTSEPSGPTAFGALRLGATPATPASVGSASVTSPSSASASTVATVVSAASAAVTSSETKLTSIAVSSSAFLANLTADDGNVAAKKSSTTPLASHPDGRPSPIKFTNQRPKQFPIQPQAERLTVTEAVRNKMLSLDNLRDSLPDFGKEEDDDEVTEITGGSDNRPNDLSTRHITPQMYLDSASTSRTVSRLSSSSQAEDGARRSETSLPPSRPTTSTDGAMARLTVMDISASKVASVTSPEASSDCKTGGLHPPSRETVNDFFRQIRGRIRYASLCGSGSANAPPGFVTDIEAEVAAVMSSGRCLEDESPGSPMSPSGPRKLRRSSSCPDAFEMANLLRQKAKAGLLVDEPSGDSITLAVNSTLDSEGGQSTASSSSKVAASMPAAMCVERAQQTDPFLVYPYEHLFPSVLPSQLLCHHSAKEEGSTGKGSVNKIENPYEILDRFIQSASALALDESAENGKTIIAGEIDSKILREEVALLHTQLLFERFRRETLGLRNRRLLGKTRSSRILEEQNTALNDQFQIVQSETMMLYSELETLRRQKHLVEEERAENDKRRDKEMEEFKSENRQLKQQKFDLETTCKEQKEKIRSAREEIARIEAALFNAKSEIDLLRKKEESRQLSENEMLRLRQEVLLLGELLRKYRERQWPDSVNAAEIEFIYASSGRNQISSLQSELQVKTNELDAYKLRTQELDAIVAKKDQAMTDQKRLLKKVKEEYDEQLKNCECAYNTLVKVQSQQEMRILELEELLSKASRGGAQKSSGNPSTTMTSGTRSSAIPSRSGPSASVDIGRPIAAAPIMPSSGSGGERTFTVGSPPSSSGSCGSDRSELIRRGLEGTRSPR